MGSGKSCIYCVLGAACADAAALLTASSLALVDFLKGPTKVRLMPEESFFRNERLLRGCPSASAGQRSQQPQATRTRAAA